MQRLADQLEADLRALGTPERAAQEKRYLKSDLAFLGVPLPAMRKVARAFVRSHPDLTGGQAVDLAETLWDSDLYERRNVAVESPG